MAFSFNPDGSIKIPEKLKIANLDKENKLKNQRSILVKKSILSDKSPKRCLLSIRVSDAISDSSFIQKTFSFIVTKSEVPMKLTKKSEKEYEIEIGTSFRRCSDCNSLVNQYREYLEGNIIVEKGSCTYESQSKNFCYEDYFS